MQESSVNQHFTQQGIELGVREGTIEAILDVLKVHFDTDEVQNLKPFLDKIEELQHPQAISTFSSKLK